MSVIDSLVIELNLDPSGMSKGAKQSIDQLRKFETQAEKTASDVSDSGRKAADFFSNVRREALGMFAVFTAGRSIKSFVGDITQSNAQLGYLSQRLNMAPAALYRMEQAAKAAGGSVGEVGNAFAVMQQKLVDPQQRANLARSFQQLGVSDFIDPATGNVRTDIVARINRSVNSSHMNHGVVQALMSGIGFGQGQINEALMDPQRLAQINKQFKGLGPTDKQIHDSQQLLQDWTALTAQNESLGRSILGDLTPGLDKVLTTVTAWEREFPNASKDVAELALAVGGLGAAVSGLMALGAVKQLLGLPAAIGAARKAAGLTTVAREAGGSLWSRLLGSTGAYIAETGALSAVGRALPFAGAVVGAAGVWDATGKSESAVREAVEARKNHKAREKQAVDYFMANGYSRSAALGIVGNLMQESGLNAAARGDYNMLGQATAFGIGQWHRGRADQIKRQYGIDVRTAAFADQLRAIKLDMESGDAGARKAGSLLRNNARATVYGATGVFRANYERPGNKLGNEDMLRFALANRASNDIGNAPSTTVHTGDIIVHTAATDADGIARDIGHSLRRQLPGQNLSGLQ